MKLKSIQIKNFKSVIDATISLDNNINYIIGRNNVGKSIISSMFQILKNTASINQYNLSKNYDKELSNKINKLDAEFILHFSVSSEEQKLLNNKFGKVTVAENVSFMFKQNNTFMVLNNIVFKRNNTFAEWVPNTNQFKIYNESGQPSGTSYMESDNKLLRLLEDFLNSVYVSVPYRKPIFTAGTRGVRTLSPEGSNITEYLYTLKLTDEKRFDELIDNLIKNENIKDLILNPTENLDQIVLDIKDLLGNQHKLTESGSGISEILFFLVLLADPKNQLIIFEEPENHLHPHAQRELINKIIKSEKQSIVITHSGDIFHTRDIKDFLKIVRADIIKELGTKYYQLNQEIDKEHPSDLINLLRLFTIQNREFIFAKKIITCEGMSDKLYYSAFLDLKNKNCDQNDISILSLEGCQNFTHYEGFFRNMNIEFYSIFDLDVILDEVLMSTFKIRINEARNELSEYLIRSGKILVKNKKEERKDIMKRHLAILMRQPVNEEEENIRNLFVILIEELAKKNVYILKYGEIEDYYIEKKGGNKTERALNATEKIDIRSKDKFMTNLEEIFNRINISKMEENNGNI